MSYMENGPANNISLSVLYGTSAEKRSAMHIGSICKWWVRVNTQKTAKHSETWRNTAKHGEIPRNTPKHDET